MGDQKFQSCITACYECAAACDNCSTACLKEEDVKKMAACIEMDMYCAAICRLSAEFMAKGSSMSPKICQICADICEACGKECGKHQMEHCQRCAQACKRCAEECRKMAA